MSINELPSKAPSAARGILDRIVMHGVDQSQPKKTAASDEKTLQNLLGKWNRLPDEEAYTNHPLYGKIRSRLKMMDAAGKDVSKYTKSFPLED